MANDSEASPSSDTCYHPAVRTALAAGASLGRRPTKYEVVLNHDASTKQVVPATFQFPMPESP